MGLGFIHPPDVECLYPVLRHSTSWSGADVAGGGTNIKLENEIVDAAHLSCTKHTLLVILGK